LAAAHASASQQFVAAPVFGRPDAAEAAKLAVVAAGPPASIERCKPLFEAMGPKLLVVGEKPSLANVVKLSGNYAGDGHRNALRFGRLKNQSNIF